MILSNTTSLIELVTGGTQVLNIHASYVDLSGTTVTPGDLNTSINSATTTTLVGSPAASTARKIKSLTIQNTDTTNSDTITVEHYDGTTTVQIKKFALLAGYSYNYEDKRGWYTADANGNEIFDQQQVHGLFIKTVQILNGTTSYTPGATTNTIKVRMIAGGGQGGGGGGTAGENGSGGGSGSYAEWTVAVTPSTAYTCAVGAGGSTGGTAANGQTGGVTTLTIPVGGTTVTCNGGVGGLVGTSVAVPVMGSLGGAVSTNGTLNTPGNAGLQAIGGTAADGASGKGADSPFGGGGNAQQEASNATGLAAPTGSFGAGGGGGTTTGTARAGGAGANGLIQIDEYT